MNLFGSNEELELEIEIIRLQQDDENSDTMEEDQCPYVAESKSKEKVLSGNK